MMLGPVLEAVVDWVLDPPALHHAEYDEVLDTEDGGDVVGAEGQFGSSLQDGLAQVLSKLGIGSGWSGGDRSRSLETDGAANILDPSNQHNSPIELCSGVLLRVFLDSPQVLLAVSLLRIFVDFIFIRICRVASTTASLALPPNL